MTPTPIPIPAAPFPWDTVGSIATACAFLLAVIALAVDVWQRIKAPAHAVAAWTEWEPFPHGVITNASGTPVYDVWLDDGTRRDSDGRWHDDNINLKPGDTDWRDDIRHAEFWSVIAPGDSIRCEWRMYSPASEDPWWHVVFTDTANRHWERQHNKLKRVWRRKQNKFTYPNYADGGQVG